MPKLRRGAANRRTLAAAVSQSCSIETATLQRTIPTALDSYHQPGLRASACYENPSLRALGAMSQQHHPHVNGLALPLRMLKLHEQPI